VPSGLPMIMMTTPTRIDLRLPRSCPKILVAMQPQKAPTSKMDTIRASIFLPVDDFSSMPKDLVKAVELIKPPIRPLSKPIRRNPRHEIVVTV
jgi:hypothetical protein